MKGFFSYDNKFMQVLIRLGDLILLNLLFVLCCIPVITIGAAQAGLYNGLRVFSDDEDDSSCVSAFFRGFTNGFSKITVAFILILIISMVAVWSAMPTATSQPSGIHRIMSCIAICICVIFQSLISLFHSRFSCTTFQLFRNAFLLFLSNPFRAIGLAISSWSFILLFFLIHPLAMLGLLPFFLTIFFSLSHLLGRRIMRKPLLNLEKMYTERVAEEETANEDTPVAL